MSEEKKPTEVVSNYLEQINSSKELNLSTEEIRNILAQVEELMKTGEEIEIPLQHYFSKAVYGREISIPKGALIMGKIHRHQNLNIISKGEVSVLSIDGLVRVKAPYTIVASPGAKRLIYAHEDTVWTTIHGTELTDLDQIENEFIAKTYDDVIGAKDIKVINTEVKKCLG